jgi:TonB family protein
MKRRDHSAAIGLCASLLVHGGVAAALIAIYAHDIESEQWWPALMRRAEAQAPRPEVDVYRDGEFGERTGHGEALNSLAGLEPFVGRLGPQDQAPLSRDPIGNGRLADEPQKATALREGIDAPIPQSIAGDGGASAPFGAGNGNEMPQPAVVARPPLKAVAVEENAELVKVKPVEKTVEAEPVKAIAIEQKGSEAEPVKVGPVKSPAQPADKAAEKVAVAVAVPQAVKTPEPPVSTENKGEGKNPQDSGQGKNNGATAAAANPGGMAGDPAPMSESESDAFSRMGNIQVRNGRVEARLGRDFKSVKPRLSLKGELDAISIAKPIVEMKVLVDETGRVIDVQVLRSSGSNEIDLPTTTAMYKWWIEPAKNKEGKAVKDVILVTFSYL